MKILYIYDNYPETYQKYLLTLLREIQKRVSVKSLVYCNDNKADFRIISYGFKDRMQRLLYKLNLSKFYSSDAKLMCQYDIVHIQHSYLWKKLLAIETLPNKPKIVITLRGGDTYIRPWIDSTWKKFYKDKSHLIDAFVVMSQNQKEYLLRWGVCEDKITVIPISFGQFSNAKPKYPNSDKLKLVSAFRMTWEKNIEGTLLFAKALMEKNINFEFDIYGGGHDVGALYYLIDRFGLNNHVFPKGKMANENLLQKLPEYDFFVQLSVSESLGMSVIEAQSKGVSCIVSNSDGLSETGVPNETLIINDYKNIDYFVEETLKLWNDKERYFSFSEKAIKNANQFFSTDKEVEKLIKLYNTISD